MARRWQGKFLSALKASGNVRIACDEAAVERSTAYRMRQRDPTFADKWDEAIEEANEVLAAEARRRALLGIDEPVFYKGQLVGYEKRYSDGLLMLLLRGARPELYGNANRHRDDDFESKEAIIFVVDRIREDRRKRQADQGGGD